MMMKKKKRNNTDSIFLNEYLMAAACVIVVITSLISLFLMRLDEDYYPKFEVIVKLITTVTMFYSFRNFSWDVAKGITGGVLFCLMYQEAYLVLGKLWGEQDFDTYLVVGIQGSIYLAASGMTFLMTVIITINHFIINYAHHGNPENVIFNKMAIIFKFVIYIILLGANSKLGFSTVTLWKNAMQYFTDIAVLLLLVCIESQFDSFKVLKGELSKAKNERRKNEHS